MKTATQRWNEPSRWNGLRLLYETIVPPSSKSMDDLGGFRQMDEH